MELIALSGPPCAGKTQLARELERRGYYFIDFCDIIKQEAARALTLLGTPTTVEEVRANKPKYRVFLQVLGELIGFNDDPRFVKQAVLKWEEVCSRAQRALYEVPAVFDNVRTPEQFAVLKPLGFQLVRLEAAQLTRFERAHEKYGVGINQFMEQERHPIEQGFDLEPDVVLDATQSPEVLAKILINLRISEAA